MHHDERAPTHPRLPSRDARRLERGRGPVDPDDDRCLGRRRAVGVVTHDGHRAAGVRRQVRSEHAGAASRARARPRRRRPAGRRCSARAARARPSRAARRSRSRDRGGVPPRGAPAGTGTPWPPPRRPARVDDRVAAPERRGPGAVDDLCRARRRPAAAPPRRSPTRACSRCASVPSRAMTTGPSVRMASPLVPRGRTTVVVDSARCPKPAPRGSVSVPGPPTLIRAVVSALTAGRSALRASRGVSRRV